MRITSLFVVVLLCLQSTTMADYMFSLNLPAFSAGQAGSAVNQDLFLVATDPNTLTSANTVEFNLDAAAGAGNTTITGFTPDAALLGSLFNASTVAVTSTGIEARLYSNGAPAVGNQVRIGSVSLLLGTAGGSTALTFSDPGATPASLSGNNVNVLAPTQTNIDANVFSPGNASFSANVSAVPEPSSLAFLTLGILGMATRRRRPATLA